MHYISDRAPRIRDFRGGIEGDYLIPTIHLVALGDAGEMRGSAIPDPSAVKSGLTVASGGIGCGSCGQMWPMWSAGEVLQAEGTKPDRLEMP